MSGRMLGKKTLHRSCELLWDLWCVGSIVGIWPRFIEPRILTNTCIELSIKDLPWDLHGLRILQFSDLHLGRRSSKSFLKKLSRRCRELDPDLLVFTGDFICYSELSRRDELSAFLNSLSAAHGCFATLGNHDYASYVSIKSDGEYGIVENDPPHIIKGLMRLIKANHDPTPIHPGSDVACNHEELIELLEASPFQVLQNETVQVPIGESAINLCGLGDLWAGQFSPDTAFKDYNADLPGIVLSHNPDTLSALRRYPGDLVLCGHTHGGQVNIPWIRDKIMVMECPRYRSGLFDLGGKHAYVNRGVGAVIPFRWFAKPELTLFTLKRQCDD